MNLGKLQDGEHGKRKKACGNRKKKKKLIDNDDFSRYLYVTQMKHTPIFLNENRKKRRKLCKQSYGRGSKNLLSKWKNRI